MHNNNTGVSLSTIDNSLFNASFLPPLPLPFPYPALAQAQSKSKRKLSKPPLSPRQLRPLQNREILGGVHEGDVHCPRLALPLSLSLPLPLSLGLGLGLGLGEM